MKYVLKIRLKLITVFQLIYYNLLGIVEFQINISLNVSVIGSIFKSFVEIVTNLGSEKNVNIKYCFDKCSLYYHKFVE